jgi:hypothetical protein
MSSSRWREIPLPGNKGLAFSSATGDSMVVQTPTIGMILKTSAAAAAYDLLLAVPRKIADDPGDCRVVQAAKTMTAPVVTADASLAFGCHFQQAGSPEYGDLRND